MAGKSLTDNQAVWHAGKQKHQGSLNILIPGSMESGALFVFEMDGL